MSEIRSGLMRAATDGVISDEQARRLYDDYLAPVPVVARTDDRHFVPVDVVDTEAPRFIRGFHDVLITIGLVIFLVALGGLGSVFAVIPGVIVLAEILVRRQRLALPAVALTIALVVSASLLGMALIPDEFELYPDIVQILLTIAPVPLSAAIFYVRYRVPLSLAAFFVSLAAMVVVLLFYLLGKMTGDENFIDTHKIASSLIFVGVAIALFALAMSFDLADPKRVTRNSDIAFWLHLATAPALLYAILVSIFLQSGASLFSLEAEQVYSSASKILVVVVLLMAIGIVIDRRAFVTSGLVSLIIASVAVLKQTDRLPGGSAIFIALLMVGGFVLTIGIGWPHLRRFVVGLLPQAIQAKLPPAR